jgi:hypothetical protein
MNKLPKIYAYVFKKRFNLLLKSISSPCIITLGFLSTEWRIKVLYIHCKYAYADAQATKRHERKVRRSGRKNCKGDKASRKQCDGPNEESFWSCDENCNGHMVHIHAWLPVKAVSDPANNPLTMRMPSVVDLSLPRR